MLAEIDPRAARDVSALLQAAKLHRQPRLGPIMVLLDNSPVLAAYGMVRSGCCAQARAPPPAAARGARGSGGGTAAAAAAAAQRRPSPFQQPQQQQMLLLMDGVGVEFGPRAGAASPDPDTASVARALEMMYYGDQSGLEWRSGDHPQQVAQLQQFMQQQQLALQQQLDDSGSAGPAVGPHAAALTATLSAPCGAEALRRGLHRTSMRTIAARHLPLLSARSVRNSTGGESTRSLDGSKGNGAPVRWADVAALRAKVRARRWPCLGTYRGLRLLGSRGCC